MAGPIYRSVGARSQSASAATISPAKPTVDNAHGLLVCVVTSKNNATHSTATAGWSKLGQTNSSASFTLSIFTAAESAAAPTITWTGAAACSAQIAYYADPQNTVDTAIGATSVATGATATHTSTAINTTRDNSLVLLLDGAAANTSLGTPSGWTLNVNGGSATDAGRTVFGSKAVATSGASSGSTSVTGANAAWVAYQIEIMGAAPGPLEVSSAEITAWATPPNDQLSASTAEITAWAEPARNALSASTVETAVWLVPNDNLLKSSTIEIDVWLELTPTSTWKPRAIII